MSLKTLWSELFSRHKPLPPGLYHSRGQDGDSFYRLHLRLEPDGRGVLVINASKILHLNQSAAELARHIVEGDSADAAVRQMLKRYRGVKAEQLTKDFDDLKARVMTLATGDDVCPITYLDIDRIEPFTTPVSAPYRMDLALTYDCNDACSHCYLPAGRSQLFSKWDAAPAQASPSAGEGLPKDRRPKELSTDQWKKIIAKVWDAGIPHVCFTGGEATLRPDLVDLIAFAEETGLVSGLLTNGRKLTDMGFVKQMAEAGLDHIQVTLESHDESIHDKMVGAPGAWQDTVAGIRNAVASKVYTITNTTLTKLNADGIEQTLAFIKSLGIATVACNGLIYSGQGADCGTGFKENELAGILERVHKQAGALGLKLIWYTPTQYCNLDPVALELGVKACTAAKYNMCVEPDGGVIPCQSYFQPLGNLLTDAWVTIWNAQPAVDIRNKAHLQDKCRECDKLPLCGGGCPIYNAQNEIVCVDSKSNA